MSQDGFSVAGRPSGKRAHLSFQTISHSLCSFLCEVDMIQKVKRHIFRAISRTCALASPSRLRWREALSFFTHLGGSNSFGQICRLSHLLSNPRERGASSQSLLHGDPHLGAIPFFFIIISLVPSKCLAHSFFNRCLWN